MIWYSSYVAYAVDGYLLVDDSDGGKKLESVMLSIDEDDGCAHHEINEMKATSTVVRIDVNLLS
jgi:hypothetical protein